MSQYKLFLSQRVVLEDAEIDGGVLVDPNGRIKSILNRIKVNDLINNSDDEIEVRTYVYRELRIIFRSK